MTLKCRDQNDVFAKKEIKGKKEKKERVMRLQDKSSKKEHVMPCHQQSSKKEHVMPCHQNVEMGFLIFCQLGLNKSFNTLTCGQNANRHFDSLTFHLELFYFSIY